MKKLSNRAWVAYLLVAVLCVGMGVIVFRYAKDADEWYANRDKGPIYTAEKFLCGRIYDRSEILLLDGMKGRQYPEDEALRRATLHLLGDVQGNIPDYLISYYREEMNAFNLFDGGTPPEDAAMHLTVSSHVQKAALDALGDRKGTVGVYNYKTGEILCMVSTPCFDPLNPGEVDDSEAYEGVYVNRFIHGSYTPGSIFKLVTAMAAIAELEDLWERTYLCEGTCEVGGKDVACEKTHGEVNFSQALTKSCNIFFARLAVELGRDCLTRYALAIGIDQSVVFDGLTTAQGHFDVSDADEHSVGWAGAGQYTDSINPCQYMIFMGAIANGGIAAQPYLVESTFSNGTETYKAHLRYGERMLRADVAERLAVVMHEAVLNNYGEENFAGLYAGAKSGTAEKDGEETANALFAGFVRDEQYPLAFVVVIENGGSGSEGGIPVIRQVLNACVAAMDTDEK